MKQQHQQNRTGQFSSLFFTTGTGFNTPSSPIIGENISLPSKVTVAEVYIVQLFVRGGGGGGNKTCTFGVFWGRKPVPE